MRFYCMFFTAVCVLFLFKLQWPREKLFRLVLTYMNDGRAQLDWYNYLYLNSELSSKAGYEKIYFLQLTAVSFHKIGQLSHPPPLVCLESGENIPLEITSLGRSLGLLYQNALAIYENHIYKKKKQTVLLAYDKVASHEDSF